VRVKGSHLVPAGGEVGNIVFILSDGHSSMMMKGTKEGGGGT